MLTASIADEDHSLLDAVARTSICNTSVNSMLVVKAPAGGI